MVMNDKPTNGAELKLMELFEEGKRFTADVLKENERLRLANANLRNEQKEHEGRVGNTDAARWQQKAGILEKEIEELRRDNESLRNQFKTVEHENRDFAERYIQVEQQNSDLISLYVASHRLHSTLQFDDVILIVKEIVINMVGAETFAVYLLDSAKNRLTMITSEGPAEHIAKLVTMGEGPVGKAAQDGKVFTAPAKTNLQENTESPIACIPLKVGDQLMGIIAIYQLLQQKQTFESVDFELFELLGGHAATAIYVSRLYSLSERKRNTLEGFLDLLKSDIKTP